MLPGQCRRLEGPGTMPELWTGNQALGWQIGTWNWSLTSWSRSSSRRPYMIAQLPAQAYSRASTRCPQNLASARRHVALQWRTLCFTLYDLLLFISALLLTSNATSQYNTAVGSKISEVQDRPSMPVKSPWRQIISCCLAGTR